MNGLVRKAEEGDILGMAALDRLCFAHPWSEQAFADELKSNPRAFYLVAEWNGELIGYAGLWAILEEGHITNVAVHPAHQNKGLGTLLLSTLIETAESQGLTAFTLEVRPSNESALALYAKFGFRIEGRRTNYYEDNGEDALILWRKQE